jgi:hypothetical protein
METNQAETLNQGSLVINIREQYRYWKGALGA